VRIPTSHPFLADPDRAAAFAYLIAHPNGSHRKWARALSWTPSKFHRFITALIELKLCAVIVTPYGSSFSPLELAKHFRNTSEPLPEQIRTTSGTPHLEASGSRSLVSRCDEKSGTAEGVRCIELVNEILLANFRSSYDPISLDNYGSHRAVVKWIAAGMSLEDMVRLLEEKARAFNPSKSGGDLPKSLGYFTRWILKAWSGEKSQLRLPLMSFERTTDRTSRRPTIQQRREPQADKSDTVPAMGETIDSVMNDLRRQMKANDA
jgi:hypothetical protein